MTKISFVNLKGGATKTSSCMLTATQLTVLGHTVTVIDLDSQGSATNWARIAEEDGTPLPFDVQVANIASLRSYKATTDFTLVDTPPTDPGAADAAVKFADVVVVPTPPGYMDTDRVWDTAAFAAPQVPTYVLMTRFDGRTKDAEELIAALDKNGVARFETVIPQNVKAGRLRGTVPDPAKFRYDVFTNELLEVL